MNKLTILLTLSFLISIGHDLYGQRTINVELRLTNASIDKKELKSTPVINTNVTIDSTSDILPIATIKNEDLGVRFVYYTTLENISRIGDNPKWEKRKIMEIEFYKKNSSENEWDWFTTQRDVIDDKIGDGKFSISSTTYNDYKSKRDYWVAYEFRVD